MYIYAYYINHRFGFEREEKSLKQFFITRYRRYRWHRISIAFIERIIISFSIVPWKEYSILKASVKKVFPRSFQQLVNTSKDSIRRLVSSMIFNVPPIITRKFQLFRIPGRFSNIFLSFRSIKDDVIVAQLLLQIFRATVMVRKLVPRDTDHRRKLLSSPPPIENQLIKFHSHPLLSSTTYFLSSLFTLWLYILGWWRKDERRVACFLWTRNLNLTIWKIVPSNLILF